MSGTVGDQQRRKIIGIFKSWIGVKILLLTLGKALVLCEPQFPHLLYGDNNTYLTYPPGLLRRLYLVMFAKVLQCLKILFKWKHFYEKRHFDHPLTFWSLCSVRKTIRSKSMKSVLCAIPTACLYMLLAWPLLHTSLFNLFSIHWDQGSAVMNNPRSCHWKLTFSMLIMKKNTNEQPY